ncbi:MAG: hypothetical protein HY703_00865 [Gemmatimonadetes bacterium]|nr:hypothetical protein [Gemmatimonadota bacterium]
MADQPDAHTAALRRAAPRTLPPLSRLHRLLAERSVPDGQDEAEPRDGPCRRPNRLGLLESQLSPWLPAGWTSEVGREYLLALYGLGLGPAQGVPPGAVGAGRAPLSSGVAQAIEQLEDTLADLWTIAREHPDLQADLVEALGQAQELRMAAASADAAAAALPRPHGPRR